MEFEDWFVDEGNVFKLVEQFDNHRDNYKWWAIVGKRLKNWGKRFCSHLLEIMRSMRWDGDDIIGWFKTIANTKTWKNQNLNSFAIFFGFIKLTLLT